MRLFLFACRVCVFLSFLFRYSMFLSDLKLGHFFSLYFCLFLAQFLSIVIFVPQGIIFIWSIKWLCRFSVRNGFCAVLSCFELVWAERHRIKVRYCCYEWCFVLLFLLFICFAALTRPHSSLNCPTIIGQIAFHR